MGPVNASHNPLLVRRGGRAAAGVVAHTETCLVSDHPVCGAKVGFARFFFMPQPPLLTRPHEEGNTESLHKPKR
jgi:hypothetical protein